MYILPFCLINGEPGTSLSSSTRLKSAIVCFRKYVVFCLSAFVNTWIKAGRGIYDCGHVSGSQQHGLRFRPVGLRSSVFVFGSSFSTHPLFIANREITLEAFLHGYIIWWFQFDSLSVLVESKVSLSSC